MSEQGENNINKHITDYLKDFVNLDNPKYAVMLIGKWGCGKTYYIKNLIKNWENETTKDEEDSVVLKPIYISLNGISDTTTITDKIKSEISPFLYKSGKIVKKVIDGLFKTVIKVDLNLDNNLETKENITFTPDIMSIFSQTKENIKGNKILIFDDVERCKIDQDELFGYINNFVEHLECKVILLAAEDKIKEEKYKEIKEKIIGQTFEIESDIATAVDVFIEDSKGVNIDLDLSKHKNLIIEIFNASQTNNIRVLRQALLDFRRLTKFIDGKLVQHPRYNEFLMNFIYYFLIVYLEYKIGKSKVSEFQNSGSSLSNNTEETENDRLRKKYNSIMDKMPILYSTEVFPIRMFLDYIKKGNIDNLLLNNQIGQSVFFLSDQTQDWEKLWRWEYWNGKYSEFKNLLHKVWKQFTEEKIRQPLVVAHIAGTMLSLIDAGLLKKNKPYIVQKSKSILKKIFEQDNFVAENNTPGLLKNTREYNVGSSPELKEITDYLDEQLKNGREKLQKDKMKNIFENLQDDSVMDIDRQISKPLPDYSTSYEDSAIFQSVNGKKLGKQIKTLNTTSIIEFKRFIDYRYYPEKRYSNRKVKDYHKKDLQCLEDLKIELSNKNNIREKIKNIAIHELVTEIENIIQKLKSIP